MLTQIRQGIVDLYSYAFVLRGPTPDENVAAAGLDYFASLTPMLRGETIPQSDRGCHSTIREPLGVAARIIAFNHPVLFAGSKIPGTLADQSCGSTSRVFLHESHHDEAQEYSCQSVKMHYAASVPTDMSMTMDPVISKAYQDRLLSDITSAA